MIDARSILVFIPNWVGDVVMATAALSAIRRNARQARITHLMRPYVRDVLAHSDLYDEVLVWPDRRGFGVPTARLIAELRRRRFDLAVLLTNSLRSAWIAWVAGARRRAGYSREGRGPLLTEKLFPPRENGKYIPIPALTYYNALAKSVGCEDVDDQLFLATSPTDEAAVDARLGSPLTGRPLVVLNPGANYGSAKCWPAEKYAELAAMIHRRYDARVVASLSPKERWIADQLAAAATTPIDIFVDPPLGLGPLKALVRRSDLLVTNDTGPRHFAAAFGVPVVTIFGSSDPAWTETWFEGERIIMLNLDCQPCMERVCPLGHHNCMKQLTADMVMAKVEELLPGGVMEHGRPRL